MRGLASGPLGVLLMVAPLVAIPVVSTFGIPQFASLVASPGEVESTDDAVSATLGDSAKSDSLPAEGVSKRTADDLFAPLDGAAQPAAEPKRESTGEALQDLVPLDPPGRGRSGKKSAARTSARPEDSLSGWEVIPESAPPGAAKRLPDDDASLGEPADEPQRRSQELADRFAEVPPSGTTRTDTGTNRRAPTEATPEPTGDLGESGELTWKSAQARLNALGIRKFHLESMPDGRFKFSGAVTSPDNPQVDRRFLTEADEPLLAVQKALDQIEAWQAGQ